MLTAGEIALVLAAFVTGALALGGAVYTGKVELKKRAPETITHGCRLDGQPHYTFIKSSRKQTPPLCAYLDPTDHKTCQFAPEPDSAAARMKEVNGGKCYIALFTDKYDLL